MDFGELIADLRKYKTQIESVLSRFTHGSEGYSIQASDDALYRRMIIEICELLDDALGDNNPYSIRISNLYRAGLLNYLSSPSYKSVEDIVGELGAALTRFNHKGRYER
jgi:hypothetical protein